MISNIYFYNLFICIPLKAKKPLLLGNGLFGTGGGFRAFNIFQVYQYFTIYRWYFSLKFKHFHEYLIQNSLKSGDIKDHFRQVKVPGTTPY